MWWGMGSITSKRPYDELVKEQIDQAIAKRGEGDLVALLNEGDTWTVDN